MTPLRFACPNCGAVLTARPDMAGRTAKCKTCGRPFVVPAVGDPKLAAAPLAATPPPAAGPIPDFSHLRPTNTDRDDGIFGDPDEDDDCVLSSAVTIPIPQVPPPARIPAAAPAASPPTARTPPTTPVLKAPPAPSPAADAGAVNPFADFTPSGAIGETQPTARLTAAGGSKARKRAAAEPGRFAEWLKSGRWKTPLLVALAVYAVAATALAVWGWARPPGPLRPSPTPDQK